MSKCEICGARQGFWHNEGCKYRIGAPFDEFLSKHIGLPSHEEKYRIYVNEIREVGQR